MKKLLTLLLGVIFSMSIQAQTTLIQEGFETLPFKFTSSNTAGASHWNTSTSLKKSGAKSDSCSVISGLTTFLLSDTFNTDGKQFVLLEFSHIAKINYLDRAEIEISVNNGNWTKLTTAMYLGTSTNFTLYGDRFDSRSYSEWDFAHDSIVPNNTWWKTEIFNISSVAKDTNNIAIRFRLSDYTPAGAVGAYGWLIDDVKISASVNEIIPPSITYTAPIYQDSVFSTGPFNISANIIDASGISSAKLFYKVNGGPLDSIPMVLGVGSNYSANIPSMTYQNSVDYYIRAIDSMQNVAVSATKNFIIKQSNIYIQVGTGTTTGSYPFNFATNFGYARSGALYKYSEVNRYGTILTLSWKVATGAATNCPIKIYIKSDTANVLTATTWANMINGATLAYSNTVNFPDTGWKTITLTTPFNYTSGNLIVLCEANYGASGTTPAPVFNYTASFTNSHYYNYANTTPPTGNGFLNTSRPNIKFGYPPDTYTQDAGITQITSPSGTIVANSNLDFQVRLRNFGSVNLVKANIYWQIDNNPANLFSWNGLLLQDVVIPILTISNNALFTVGNHTIRSWTDLPNDSLDQNHLNDTAYASVYACSSILNGSYTLGGVTADFPTFAAANVALQNCGVIGPVIFRVNPGTYNEKIVFTPINGASTLNTITFQSANGDSTSVIIQDSATAVANNYIFKLDGADFFKFIKMTFNQKGATYGNCINISNGSINNQFSNNRFLAPVTATNSFDRAIFYSPTGLTSVDSNNLISNNLFSNGAYGVYMGGGSTTVREVKNIVSGNTFTNQNGFGIYLYYQDGTQVLNNTITTTVTNVAFNGIYSNYCYNKMRIWGNKISAPNTHGYGISIYYNTGLLNSEGLVANNFISMGGVALSNAYGIYSNYSTFQNYYYNSINVTSTYATSAGIYIAGTGTLSLNVKNNIFNNTGTGYSYYVATTTGIVSDYNDLYTAGANLGYWTANRATLAAWRTASLQDNNSISTNPYFFTPTNLHLSNVSINAKATPISGISIDIDGDDRDAATPDIGADEFFPINYDLALITVIAPVSNCSMSTTETVTVRIKNFGINPITTATLYYSIDNGTPVQGTFNGNILTDSIYDFTFTTPANIAFPTNYIFKFWATMPNDNNHVNDTLSNWFVNSGFDLNIAGYTQGFETSEYSADWSILNVNSDFSMWMFPYVGNAYQGTRSARFQNGGTLAASDWLFSRCFVLDASKKYKVEYWYKVESATYPQNLLLKYGTAKTTLAMVNTLVTQSNIVNTTYQKATSIFIPPTSGTYYLGFLTTSAATAYGLYLDNINLSLVPDQEASIAEMSAPNAGCGLGNETVSIKILNNGSGIILPNTLTAYFKVIGGTNTISQLVSDTIKVDSIRTFTFSAPADLSVTTTDVNFQVKSWISLPGDPYQINDTISKIILSKHLPPAPVVTTATVAYGGTALLNAVCADSVSWYNSAVGGSILANTHYFTTPILYYNSIFWVASKTAGGTHSWTFDNSLNGWTSVNSCSSATDFMWNSDGGVGTAYINDSPITSAGLLTSPIINVAGSDTIRITFKHKYDTESCCDHGYVAYSTNGGATWNQFTPTTNTYNNASSTNFGQDPLSSCSATTRASFSGTSPGYIISSGKFAISGVSTLKLAFVFQTDVSLGATGWYIDSVGVDAGNGGCASNRVPDTVFVASVPVEASMMSIPFPVTECSESSELVKIKIRNNGTDTINGNLQATYKILNTLTSVTELVPNIIPPSDSILYTFTTPILTGLSTANIDSTFNLKIFVSLAGDPYPLNDTLTKTVTLNYTPPSPILTNTNAAYASSVVLQALSPDSVSWFSVPVGGTQLVNSHFLTTPVLYDTTVFWAQTSTSGGSHSWTFDNDLAGWTGTNTCTYASNFVWNSDGGVGAAYIVEPGTYSVGLLTSPLIDVTNLDTVKLTFKHRYDTEGCCDKGYVAYSVNGGATWTPFVPTINTYNNPSTTSFPNDPLASCAATTRASYSGASGGYIISSGKIALPLGSASLKLAFAFESDVSVTGAGWFIDSVAVDGGSGGCPSVRVPDTVFVSAPPACEVGVTQIIAPNSSAYLGASEQLKVNIKNFGSSIQTSIPVCYKVGASAVVNDTLNAILNPGDSVTFTFATPVDLSAIQSFNIISYTHASCDLIFSNDTAYRTITHSQYCTSGATSTADEDIGNFTFGNINQGSAVPITSNPSATGLYSNFTTSLPPVYLAKGSTYPISASIVFSGTTSYQGLLNTYIDYNVDGVFDATSEKVFTSVYSPNFTVTGSVTIPLTAASGLSRLRVVADEADLAPPCGTYTFGETEDYSVMIYAPILQDAGVVAFVEPSDSVYNENDSLPVIAKIRNFGTTPITSVQVTATYNALPLGSVVWVGSLAPGAETNVTFNNILCHLAYNNNLCAYTTLAGDSNTFNNNLCKVFRGRPAHDVGAIALVAPTANSCFTANETVIVRIKNFGMKKLYFNQDTVRVYASMAGANPGSFGPTILSSDSLSVGDSMNVVVTTNANMSVGGNYIFNGNTQMTNDGNTANDAFVSSVLTATPTAILPDTVGFTTFTGADLNTGYPHWTEGTGYLYPTGTTSAWLSQSGLGASGNITARINMYTSTRNEWLIGSKFTSTPGTTLEFDAAVTDVNSIALADSMGTDDSVKVMLSTNCGVTWNKIFAITKANHLPNTLTHFSVNLGAYSGQLLRLAFKAQDGPYDDVNDYDFQLDNINIWNKVINIGVNQIVHAVSDTLCVGKEDTVMVRIKNFGNMDASNFPVSYWLTNNSIPTTAVIENFPDTIAPGQEKYFSFGTLFHPTQQVFNLCARTLHTLDMDSTDDKTCRSFIAYINCVGIDEIDFDGFNLGQNIPNPALDNTLINYSIPSNGKVNFQIMSLVGQQIYAEESNAQSGANQITVDTRNMAAGIYYYSVSYKGKRLTKKMIIAK